jgi:hypothetical protein
MYNLFKLQKWNPKKYFDMSQGEKIVTKAFLHKMIEEHNEEIKRVEEANK